MNVYTRAMPEGKGGNAFRMQHGARRFVMS